MLAKSDLLAERAGRPLQLPAHPRVAPMRPPTPLTASSGLDERVVMLIVGLALAACVGLIVGLPGLVATASAQPQRVATLVALTLALQMFSVQVYGRGHVSVSAIGVLASAFIFNTGTTMAIALLAALAQCIRTRSEEGDRHQIGRAHV